MAKVIKIKEPAFTLAWENATRKLWEEWTEVLRKLAPATEEDAPLACTWCDTVIPFGTRVIVGRTTFDNHVSIFCATKCQHADAMKLIQDAKACYIPPGDDPDSEFAEYEIGE